MHTHANKIISLLEPMGTFTCTHINVVWLGMGIVKVLTVLLLLSIRYFNGILIGTFCYLYIYIHIYIHTYTYMYEIYISMIDLQLN